MKIGLSFTALALAFSLIFPAITDATVFQPGETLEPDCAPGSVDCGVATFSLNGQAESTQTFASGTSGSDFAIVSGSGVHTFNIPSASSSARGFITASDWNTFNAKQPALGYTPLNLANNLSDLSNAGTARTNLGLGSLATQSGTFSGTSSGINTGDQTAITGNAGTATALQTARAINGVAFDGTSDITITAVAGAGTLTGTTLANNVVNSSLTSVGTLSSLTLSGAIIGATGYNGLVITPNTGVITTGTWNGTTIAVTNGGTGVTTLNDLITLSTHTTGNYVATIAGSSQISVSGSGSENSSVSLSLITDSIGDTQLAFDTGQTLSTSASPTFAGLTVGSIGTDTLVLTNTGTLNGLDAIDTTTESTLEAALDIAGDVTGTGLGSIVIGPDAVALSTDTTGNYVATLTAGLGLTGSSSIEGGTPTLALDTSASLSGDHTLSANEAKFGLSGLIFEGSSANTFETYLTVTDPTADRTITFADGSITVNAAADISGTTLSSNVTASSLTSVGTLGSLALSGAVTGATSYNGLVITANTGAITTGTWTGTTIAVANGGTGTTTGSITGSGALSFTSATTNALTLDSGTTGAVNIATNANAKTITIGNGTGSTTVNINSGTGNLNFQVAGTSTTGRVQVGAGGSGSTTPDLFLLDAKSSSGDPTGTNGAMYYNVNTNKFRCYENSAWVNCIGSGTTSDAQHAASYDTNEAMTNVPTGGAQVTLGTVSVTPTSVTGDVYVAGWADLYSGSGTDQPLQLVIETTSNCTGSTVGNASVTYTITSGSTTSNVRGTVRVSGIAVDPGMSAQPYSLCAAVTSGGGNTDVMNWGIEALVIDTGADLAEIYTTHDATIVAGDVVSLDTTLVAGVKKSQQAYDQHVLGVVSTRPGLLIGSVNKEGVMAMPVALAGRVPVKVVNENGAIKEGDYLTPSSVPGVAMKSLGTGPVIGQAMGDYDQDEVGMVMVFIKNFSLGESTVLLGESSSGLTAYGLTSLVTSVQAEAAHNPVAIITSKIADGTQFLTDFVAARVTAIRGYFDEIFAGKIHSEELCLKKADGTETCLNGDQVENLLQATDTPAASPEPVEPQSTPVAESAPTDEVNPEDPEAGSEVTAETPDESPIEPVEAQSAEEVAGESSTPASEAVPVPESAPPVTE